MPFPRIDEEVAVKTDRGLRLDSWKEVAAYLHRGERTVKRWEKSRGLPAHRVPGGGHASIYAYTVELDRWLESTAANPDLDLGDSPASAEDAEQWDDSIPPDLAAVDAPSPLPEETYVRTQRGKRLLTLRRFLLLGGVGLAACVVVFRSTDLRISTTRQLSRITESQMSSNRRTSTVASEAEKSLTHDLYLKGRYQWNQRTPDSLNRALDSFTQAIVHDPGDAKAYVGLADTYNLLREYTTMPESEAYARALSAARKAVELDDSLAEAHRALAFAETNGEWNFVDGEREYRRAIELDPNDPIARRWYANSFDVPARIHESLDQINKAQEIDPTSQSTLADKGLLLFKSGKREEGIELLKEVGRADPEFRSPHYYLMLISFIMRNYPAYLVEGEKAARSRNDPVLLDTILAARAGYVRKGEGGLLQRLYAKQRKYYELGKIPGTMLAKTCLPMGKRQEALQLLEEDYAHHNVAVLNSLSEPDFLTLKDEPRYKALLKKINFPAASIDVLPGTTPSKDKTWLQTSSRPH
jgi:tetratricopeptide (TPR) repeat protein